MQTPTDELRPTVDTVLSAMRRHATAASIPLLNKDLHDYHEACFWSLWAVVTDDDAVPYSHVRDNLI